MENGIYNLCIGNKGSNGVTCSTTTKIPSYHEYYDTNIKYIKCDNVLYPKNGIGASITNSYSHSQAQPQMKY